MEALWIFPLYFLCPLTGIIFIILWFAKRHQQSYGKRRLILGIILLLLPFLHQLLMYNQQNGVEDELVGFYNFPDSTTKFLKINSDKSFELFRTNPPKFQKGQWNVVLVDDYEIYLVFPDNKNQMYHIAFKSDQVVLQDFPGIDRYVKRILHSH